MKYAVIELQGKQYSVSEGSSLTVDRVLEESGKKGLTPQVLLFADGDKIQVGTPYLDDISVDVVVEGNQKGKKIMVRRFHAKSGYRRVNGHRQPESLVRVIGIKAGKSTSTKPASAVKSTKITKKEV